MPKWVIVEDEADLLDTLMAMFEVWGIDGVSLTNGIDAMDWINKVDHGLVNDSLPQLALIDIRLPGVSGIDVAYRLRESKRLGGIGIALMTAYYLSPQEEAEAMRRSQADVLIHKPLPGMKELRQVLNKILR